MRVAHQHQPLLTEWSSDSLRNTAMLVVLSNISMKHVSFVVSVTQLLPTNGWRLHDMPFCLAIHWSRLLELLGAECQQTKMLGLLALCEAIHERFRPTVRHACFQIECAEAISDMLASTPCAMELSLGHVMFMILQDGAMTHECQVVTLLILLDHEGEESLDDMWVNICQGYVRQTCPSVLLAVIDGLAMGVTTARKGDCYALALSSVLEGGVHLLVTCQESLSIFERLSDVLQCVAVPAQPTCMFTTHSWVSKIHLPSLLNLRQLWAYLVATYARTLADDATLLPHFSEPVLSMLEQTVAQSTETQLRRMQRSMSQVIFSQLLASLSDGQVKSLQRMCSHLPTLSLWANNWTGSTPGATSTLNDAT
jgi:hypothetical protein